MTNPDLCLGLSKSRSPDISAEFDGPDNAIYYTALDSTSVAYPHLYLASVRAGISPRETAKVEVPEGQDFREYRQTQLFEPHGSEPELAPCILFVALTPAEGGDEDFERWYREEHLQMYSTITHFRRTTRYELISSVRRNVPKYLAIHEFESKVIPLDQLARARGTEWAKKVLSGVQNKERGVYELVR